MYNRFYIDFEFVEGKIPQQVCGRNIPQWLSKPNNTIQPISVGIVSGDGREYYAIFKEFNLKEAWNRFDIKQSGFTNSGKDPAYEKVYWIRENVLKPIFDELFYRFWNEPDYLGFVDMKFDFDNLKYLINKYGKTSKQIADEIKSFIYEPFLVNGSDNIEWVGNKPLDIEFYGYVSSYDFVQLCWLYNKLIDLPKGFPNICTDLKQIRNEKEALLIKEFPIGITTTELNMAACFELSSNNVKRVSLKLHPDYPKSTNAHHSLDDAKFNKQLHEFLMNI